MRAITGQENAVLNAADGHSVHARVWVYDGAEYQDITALEGRNWLVSVEWNESVNEPCAEATVTLRRRLEDYSLNPLVSNKLTGLLALARPFIIETATVPAGDPAEESDFREVFRGIVETISMDKDPLVFSGRDMSGPLSRTFIETEREYGSDAGVAVETIIQSILTDNATGVTLYVKNVAGGTTTGAVFGRFKQKKMAVLAAVREVALKIGWDLRYLWSDTASAFRFTLIEPDRAATATDWTFPADKVKGYTKLSQTLFDIRNAQRLYYYNRSAADAAGVAPLAYVTAEDAASIAAYGRQYMQLAEPEDSPIDSASEAQVMVNAALADLKDPLLDAGVDVDFHYAVQLGDMLTFEPDDLHFTSAQTLAVVSAAHRIDGRGHSTSLQLRGKPVGANSEWLDRDSRVRVLSRPPTSAPDAVSGLTATATAGGAVITFTAPLTPPLPVEFELHLSTTSGFTPSVATLNSKSDATSFTPSGLTPGTTYYAKVVGRDRVGNRSAAAEASFTTRYVEPRALQPRIPTAESLTMNPTMEAASDAATPPDGWAMGVGTWGADASLSTSALTGAYSVHLLTNGTTIRTSITPVFEASRYAFEFLVMLGHSSVQVLGAIEWLDASLAVIGSSLETGVPAGANPTGQWLKYTDVETAPVGARYARVMIRRQTGTASYGALDSVVLRRADAIQEESIPISTVSGYSNGWTAYLGGGSTSGVSYYKDTAGCVHIEGHMSTGLLSSTAFTLPAGYRPPKNRDFAIATATGYGQLLVASDGSVRVQSGSNTWASLAGVSFRAA